MRKRILSTLLAVFILVSALAIPANAAYSDPDADTALLEETSLPDIQADDTSEAPYFADVPADHWAFPYIQRVYADGIVGGTGRNSAGAPLFSPDESVTFVQAEVILARVFFSSLIRSIPGDSWYDAELRAVRDDLSLSRLNYLSLNTPMSGLNTASLFQYLFAAKNIAVPAEITDNLPDDGEIVTRAKFVQLCCLTEDAIEAAPKFELVNAWACLPEEIARVTDKYTFNCAFYTMTHMEDDVQPQIWFDKDNDRIWNTVYAVRSIYGIDTVHAGEIYWFVKDEPNEAEASNMEKALSYVPSDSTEITRACIRAVTNRLSYQKPYDNAHWDNNSPYGVCNSFTRLTGQLMAYNGVYSIYCHGPVSGYGVGHAWQYAYLDGEWRAIDSTVAETRNTDAGIMTPQEHADFWGYELDTTYETDLMRIAKSLIEISVKALNPWGFNIIMGSHSVESDIGWTDTPTCNPNWGGRRVSYNNQENTFSISISVGQETTEKKDDGYQNNCGNCTVAYEMRRRGYDVEAQSGTYVSDYTWEAYFDNAKVYFFSGDGTTPVADALAEKLLDSFPEGARGSIRIAWDDGSKKGHFFSWEIRDGKVMYVDAQCGDFDVSWYFGLAKEDNILYMRWDDREPSSQVASYCKNREA